jgi:hypothetical protein
MAVKFMGARTIELLGMRGYQPVFDSHGNPVRVGTLFMVEISQESIERRRQRLAAENAASVADPCGLANGSSQNDEFWDTCRLAWHVWYWRGVLALYAYNEQGTTRRGIELQTQFRGAPRLRRWRFYALALPE